MEIFESGCGYLWMQEISAQKKNMKRESRKKLRLNE
jgi:hypothetical protein